MRRIIESTLVSLDGVFENPHLWATEYFDSNAEEFALELLSGADAMLMGRGTYEFFAQAFPHRTGAYAERVNGIRKYVFSKSRARADWSNASIVSGEAAAEVRKFKAEGGGDLVMYGHGRLSRTLLAAGLLDELKLWIHPCYVGHGELMFQQGEEHKLQLLSTKTLATGVIVATYAPRSG